MKGGKATITAPDNHLGDPRLYLKENIKEVNNIFEKTVPGRTFELQVANETTNNFENLIKLEIVADGKEYIYEVTQPIYSQSEPVLHVFIPTSKANLRGKEISSIRSYYYHAIEGRYIEMGETYTSIPDARESGGNDADVLIYNTNGMLVKHIKANEVANSYCGYLNALPRGVYLIKEGKIIRKVIQ